MGNTGANTGVTRWGTSFSSIRTTRRKRRLKNHDAGKWWFIYFIQAQSGMIKIGYARNVTQRFANIQACNPEDLAILLWTQGDPVAEERLHAAFAKDRAVGEWFRPSEALMAFIAELKMAIDWAERSFR